MGPLLDWPGLSSSSSLGLRRALLQQDRRIRLRSRAQPAPLTVFALLGDSDLNASFRACWEVCNGWDESRENKNTLNPLHPHTQVPSVNVLLLGWFLYISVLCISTHTENFFANSVYPISLLSFKYSNWNTLQSRPSMLKGSTWIVC